MEDKNKQAISSEDLSKIVAQGMLEKKAADVVIIELKGLKNAIADYFVIGSGTSDTQVEAIADGVEEMAYKNAHQNPWHTEGEQNKEWILIDYVDVVAHVFKKDRRAFFALEDLWGDAKIVAMEP